MKVGRNDPCSCGSGKKYKQCCLRKDEEAQLARATVENERRAEFEREQRESLREEREFLKSELREVFGGVTVGKIEAEDEFEDEWESEEEFVDDEENGWEVDEDEEEESEDEPEEEADDELNEEFEEEDELEPKAPLSSEEKQKHEAQAQAERAEADAFWKNFHEQDLQAKVALFENKLAEPKPLHSGYAFDMLTTIYKQAVTENARALYAPLIEKLRQHSPKAYQKNSPYYLENLISESLVADRSEALPALVKEIAFTSGRNPDTFGKVLAQLAYHGRLQLVNEAMHVAWPIIKKSGDIVPWAVDEYAAEGVRGLVLDYLERHGAPEAGDAALFEAVSFFAKVPQGRLNGFIALISGHNQRQWRPEDFDFKKKASKRHKGEDTPDRPSARENLISLSMKFQGYLHRARNVSYTKSELARESIVKYIFRRLNGDLKPRQGMMNAVLRPKPARQLKDPPYHPEWPAHVRVLCPHPNTFERFLIDLLHILNPEFHKLAALFEFIPAWLEFLVVQQLIEPVHQDVTLQELRRFHNDLLNVFEPYSEDPALHQALLRWPEQVS